VAALVAAALLERDPVERPRMVDTLAYPETTFATAPGCPPPRWPLGSNAGADFSDFVQANGTTYVNHNRRASTLSSSRIGTRVATVCESYQSRRAIGPLRDGDASYLAEGTPIYTLRDYNPTFRLAAERNGQLVIFEADTNPSARLGRELMDLSTIAVQSVVVRDSLSGGTIARIDELPIIGRLIELLRDAPVDQARQPLDGTTCLIEFVFADGTSSSRTLWLDHGFLLRGIVVGPEFVDIIRRAVR
jgi:hypothetical protein